MEVVLNMGTRLEKLELSGGMSLVWSDFTKGTFIEHNGIYLTEISKGHVRGEIKISPHHLNPAGILHGGAIVALADTVAIFGCGYLYEAINVTTVGLTVSYVKPAAAGVITATGKVISKGKSLSLWQVDVHDGKGNVLAVVNVTYSVVS